MDDEATQATQNTQGVLDPRRMGRNNSGLSEGDIADVMCILHPCSPAAFRIVALTAERTPQNVLQNHGFHHFDDNLTPSELEEEQTFIIHNTSGHSNQAMDLALRLSAPVKNIKVGFVFGRNPDHCDIVVATDTCKRVSNMHFNIYVNGSGVLLLQDMSTNGTIVDDILLRGKGQGPQTRMLNSGSIIQILSPKAEELVKFIVRIPSREGFEEQYRQNFDAHIANIRAATQRTQGEGLLRRRPTAADPITQKGGGGSLSGPLMHNTHGMHWSGGDSYNVVGLIGKGAFATVYQLATKSEGHLYAAKELEKRRFMKNGIMDRKLDNEMQIMKSISHKNIVQFLDYVDQPKHMYIIMEFVPCGDLQQYLQLHGPLHEVLAKQMAEQVLDALAYLHKKKITHRDIKPDNILLANMETSNFTVKLSDFGLSKVVKDNETFLKTFCGTLLYCAPEVFPHYDTHVAGKGGNKRPRKSKPQQPSPKTYHSYSQTVDIWSFGAVLWYALCVRPPFEGVADNTGRGMFDKIMMTPLDVTDLAKQGVSDDAVALLVEMLNTDPSTRPSPTQCLRHRWFGLPEDAVAGADENGLVPIAEEVEGEYEFDVSGLSLDERDSSHESQTSEVSIHSGSLEFLDPRQSKRFKPNTQAYREQEEFIESSPEIFHQSIPIMHQPALDQAQIASRAQTQPPRPKLFGEISLSALGRAGNDVPTSDADEGHGDGQNDRADGPDEDERRANRGDMASPSLLGAESMVRDLNMHSPQSASNSQGADSNGPSEPRTPAQSAYSSPQHAQQEDVTPRPKQQAFFSRQINIPIPASFYYSADDPSTHTLEYASKVSGHDYLASPSYIKEPTNDTSMPATMSAGSATDNAPTDDENESNEEANRNIASVKHSRQITLPPADEFVKPPPRLGRLVSTPDSFSPITINLSARITSWGRDPSNTHRYPDAFDRRIAKRAIFIYFHAKGIEAIPEEDQRWMKLPDLHCLITTQSSLGVWVNGVQLKKAEVGKWAYGRVYSGDVVEVVGAGKDGKGGLRFVCEFFHGEGRSQRPQGAAPFKQMLTEVPASKGDKGKGKERADVEGQRVSAAS